MGVSDGGDGGGLTGVDCSVGTIVWVRRRNGSWWPGRILGPEELSVSHLMSPRSGTPVKLLGREDASVIPTTLAFLRDQEASSKLHQQHYGSLDWYNLEKSKRVKAFRCGEFDACIEKAEASLGVPIKKREKYARREDAILHALELERKQLEMRQQKQAVISNGITSSSLGTLKREFKNLSSSDTFTRNDESSVHSKFSIRESPTLPRKTGLLHEHEEENINNSTNVNDRKSSKQIGWEEDISESPRMRGLHDFGLRIAPKKKLPQSAAWLTTKEPAENTMDVFPSAGEIMGGRGHVRSSKDTFAIKRKRSHCGMVEESIVKKRDRRRPLLQVLQSSAKLQAFHSSQLDHYPDIVPMHGEKDCMGVIRRAKRRKCIYLPTDSVDSQDDGGYSSEDMQTPAEQFGMANFLVQPGSLAEDCTSSGMIETEESDSSIRDYLETDTEEGDILGDTGQFLASRPKVGDPSSSNILKKPGEMDNDEVPFSGYISQLHRYEHSADASAEMEVSKSHVKGKRNIRNLVKRPVGVRDGKICVIGSDKCDSSIRGTAYGVKCSTLKMDKMEPSSRRTIDQGSYLIKKEDNYAYDEVDLVGQDFIEEQIDEYDYQRYPLVSKTARDLGRSHMGSNNLEGDPHLMSISGWEADGPPHWARRKYWEESDEYYDPIYASYVNREMGSNLFDVNLKVKASYQGEHVPLVSLMSRLNGKAIVGHPVQIEILEDGSTSQYFGNNYSCPDESTTHQPVWRTARRTAMQRIPRSNPVTSFLEDDEAGGFQLLERDNKPPPDMHSGHSQNPSRLTKKRVFLAHRPPSGNFQKSQKKASLSSQKTRTLFSFATEHRLRGENGHARLARGSGILGGLMRPGEQVPTVTCVPVKVAFSRILEAIGRSSSTMTRHVRMTNAPIRDSSQR